MLKCKFKCSICHKQFRTSQHLRQHQNKKKPCKENSISTNEQSYISDSNHSFDYSPPTNLFDTKTPGILHGDFFDAYNKLLEEYMILKNKLLECQYKYSKLEVENKILHKKNQLTNMFIAKYMENDDMYESKFENMMPSLVSFNKLHPYSSISSVTGASSLNSSLPTSAQKNNDTNENENNNIVINFKDDDK